MRHLAARPSKGKAVVGDGGSHCRKLGQIIDEPLIEGMVLGTEKDMLSLDERQEVSITTSQASKLYPKKSIYPVARRSIIYYSSYLSKAMGQLQH